MGGTLPSKEGTTSRDLNNFTGKPRPESGHDCLICADFARQRPGQFGGGRSGLCMRGRGGERDVSDLLSSECGTYRTVKRPDSGRGLQVNVLKKSFCLFPWQRHGGQGGRRTGAARPAASGGHGEVFPKLRVARKLFKCPGLRKLSNVQAVKCPSGQRFKWSNAVSPQLLGRGRGGGHWRENSALIRQSRPDSGLGFQGKGINTFQVVPFSLGSGEGAGSEVWCSGLWGWD